MQWNQQKFVISIVISMKKMPKYKLFNNMLCFTNQSVESILSVYTAHPEINDDQ